jgi:hypothetical protein
MSSCGLPEGARCGLLGGAHCPLGAAAPPINERKFL